MRDWSLLVGESKTTILRALLHYPLRVHNIFGKYNAYELLVGGYFT